MIPPNGQVGEKFSMQIPKDFNFLALNTPLPEEETGQQRTKESQEGRRSGQVHSSLQPKEGPVSGCG